MKRKAEMIELFPARAHQLFACFFFSFFHPATDSFGTETPLLTSLTSGHLYYRSRADLRSRTIVCQHNSSSHRTTHFHCCQEMQRAAKKGDGFEDGKGSSFQTQTLEYTCKHYQITVICTAAWHLCGHPLSPSLPEFMFSRLNGISAPLPIHSQGLLSLLICLGDAPRPPARCVPMNI